MDKKSILIVGGSGFIGSHLIMRAVSLDWSVVSLGLSDVKLDLDRNKFNHYCVSLNDKAALKEIIYSKDFDYVINCSGYIDHSGFGDGGEEVFNTHYNGLSNLIAVLNKDKIKNLINIGSSDEYGSCTAPQREDLREQPISPYSLAKVFSSHLLRLLNISEGLPSTTVRLFLVYGPHQDDGRFIPSIIKGCLNDEDFPCSKGNQLRDFCYIDDVVDGIFSILDQSSAEGEVLNIASGDAIKIKDVVEKVRLIIGHGQPQYGEIPFRSGENLELYANISKAKTMLNWEPKISLDEGLRKTIDWYRMNNG